VSGWRRFELAAVLTKFHKLNMDEINPIVAKAGGLQSQGAKGEAVGFLPRTLGNAGSGVLRLSRRVNNMAKIDPIHGMHMRLELPTRTVYMIFARISQC
jgi:hypothetical protein